MNDFKRANHALVYNKIVNECEDKVRYLEREIVRLKADNDILRSKVENTKYFVNSRIYSLKGSLKKEPDRVKRAQLELCLDVQEELK